MSKMCSSIKSSGAQQRGIALIEALVSMVIIAVTCAGSLYVVSRANAVKTEMSLQEIAVHQLRQKLTSGAIDCTAPGSVTLPNIEQALVVTIESGCAVSGTSVTVNGAAVSTVDTRMVLSVTDANIFAGSGKIIVGGS